MPTPANALHASIRALRRVRDRVPTGGVADEDWAGRHRLLTRTMIASAVLVTGIAVARHVLDMMWLVSVVLIVLCALAALLLPPRRLPSSAVAIGLTVVCADLVMVFDGLTEAHFSFFVAVGALALYRDWVPFSAFLVGTVVHHALFGALMTHRTYDHEGAYQHPWLWALIHGVAVLLAAATQVLAWQLSEVEQRRAREDLSQAEAQFTAAFEEAPVAMSMVSPDGVLFRVNPAFSAWLGLTGPLPPGCQVADLPIRAEPPNQPPRLVARFLSGQLNVIREECRFRLANGTVVDIDLHANALRDSEGRLKVVVVHYLDVTEKRASEARLRQKVREDSLTGLLSRNAFEGDLAALVEARASQVSVIYVDIDRFKAINDSHGHGAGDEVLRIFGGRLARLAPDDVLIARLGGDEFALALPGDVSRGEHLGRMIIEGCAETLVVGGGRLNMTASVGVCAARAGETAEATLQNADLAMYAAKQAGRGRIKMFDDTMRLDTQRRVVAEAQLRSALDDPVNRLPVWFQPIISLSSRKIIGAEALIRLRSTDGTLVQPGAFIPIAEETALIVPLGEHVLRTALAQLQAWGDLLPYVSVNVSPRQLSETGFVPMLADELAASGLVDRSRLVLEITETAILQSTVDLHHRLDAIKQLGVRIALDDFGTGYSSLTWLQEVPADIVKLDRSFVAGLARTPAKTSIIYAVLWLAKALNMQVIAEGVEEMEDAEMLVAAGCQAAQGYLFSRPIEPSALETLLGRGMTPDSGSSSGFKSGFGTGKPSVSGAPAAPSIPAIPAVPSQLSRTTPSTANVL